MVYSTRGYSFMQWAPRPVQTLPTTPFAKVPTNNIRFFRYGPSVISTYSIIRQHVGVPMHPVNRLILPLLAATTATIFATGEEQDWLFITQRSFTSALLKGQGNAGIAFPGDINLGTVNPALFYSRGMQSGSNRQRFSVGYGRNALFNRHIVPLGATYRNGNSVIAGFYRFLSGDAEITQHEFTGNLSGQLFSKANRQGAVDFGINVRIEQMVDTHSKQFPLTKQLITQISDAPQMLTIDSTTETTRFSQHQRRGYARAPGSFPRNVTSLTNSNFFSAGAGVVLAPVSCDFYLSQETFGLTMGYRY